MTLVELVVAVAVLSILAVLAAPSFQNMLASNRVSALTNELSAALNLARSEAIKLGRTVTICKSSNTSAAVTALTPACSADAAATWPDGWLVFVDQGALGTRDGGGDTLIRVGQPEARNVIQTGGDFVRSVTFFPNGSSSAAGDQAARTFTLCIAPAQRQVIISRTGQIQVLRGSCA